MLFYERIDINERIHPAKSNNTKECMICHYWFFNRGFKFQHSICNGCNDLAMLNVNISDIGTITTEGADYRCIIYDISKSETINLLNNYVLEDCG